MVIFKICAIARDGRSAWPAKLGKDALDLAHAVEYLEARKEVIPKDIHELLELEEPKFQWENFWNAMARVEKSTDAIDTAALERSLHKIGIPEVRLSVVSATSIP